MKNDQARRDKKFVQGLFCIAIVVIAALAAMVANSNSSSNSSSSSSTPYVSDGEFDQAYGQFRGSGMSESESGAAARATTNFLNNQRASQAAEADRQR